MQRLEEHPPGPISRVVLPIRIADDDLYASAVHCPNCLGKLGAHVYPAPLKHGCEEAGVVVRVIDLVVEAVGLNVTVANEKKIY